jgi:hypothetical protein
MSLAAFLILLLYYIIVWRVVRTAEPLETIIPLFSPPKNLPVTAVSFIYNKGISRKTLPATIVDLAVNGYLKIIQEKHALDNAYILQKTGSPLDALPAIEKTVIQQLFGSGDYFRLGREYRQFIKMVTSILKESLEEKYAHLYFCDNSIYIIGGAIFTVAAWFEAFFLSNWIIQPQTAILAVLTLGLNFAFRRSLRSYTPEGKDLKIAIEGFKMFLEVTDKFRLEQAAPPGVTPELFEKYFAYAIALNIERKWADKLSQHLETASQPIQTYQPVWYSRPTPCDVNQFTSDLGTGFCSAIISPPSSANAPNKATSMP